MRSDPWDCWRRTACISKWATGGRAVATTSTVMTSLSVSPASSGFATAPLMIQWRRAWSRRKRPRCSPGISIPSSSWRVVGRSGGDRATSIEISLNVMRRTLSCARSRSSTRSSRTVVGRSRTTVWRPGSRYIPSRTRAQSRVSITYCAYEQLTVFIKPYKVRPQPSQEVCLAESVHSPVQVWQFVQTGQPIKFGFGDPFSVHSLIYNDIEGIAQALLGRWRTIPEFQRPERLFTLTEGGGQLRGNREGCLYVALTEAQETAIQSRIEELLPRRAIA